MLEYKHIFFLGAGGIGMSAIVRYCLENGISVSGYDKTPTELTDRLIAQGAEIFFSDTPNLLTSTPDLVVYTPAVPKDTALFKHFEATGLPMMKRAQILGAISKGKPTIAIAGTHGKTTISTMVAHILHTAGFNFTAFLGGISANYGTNYVKNGTGEDWIIAEADEFDRSFLELNPQLALISSIDADHLDIYGTEDALVDSFSKFVGKIKSGGVLIQKSGLPLIQRSDISMNTYHLDAPADYTAALSHEGNGTFKVQLQGKIETQPFSLGLPGRHNLENAVGAAAIASMAGVMPQTIAHALATFKGVKRRFEKCFQGTQWVYYDDYAHHPEEIKATLGAIREMYPAKHITAVFQPHLFSRTRDLSLGFAESLQMADKLLLLDIYPARELPIEGVTSAWLLEMISMNDKQLVQKSQILKALEDTKPGVLITMGAGDIDRLVADLVSWLKIND
ncbi:MAG TPA: UDP-N-acetylmuramate--L-alanine ligase [Bacteroidales bacterium]|nr:UDP-N-acetylmuramate--L-alanine ligase [Bacteroidales bacterium]